MGSRIMLVDLCLLIKQGAIAILVEFKVFGDREAFFTLLALETFLLCLLASLLSVPVNVHIEAVSSEKLNLADITFIVTDIEKLLGVVGCLVVCEILQRFEAFETLSGKIATMNEFLRLLFGIQFLTKHDFFIGSNLSGQMCSQVSKKIALLPECFFTLFLRTDKGSFAGLRMWLVRKQQLT